MILEKFKAPTQRKFDMTDLGLMKYFLFIEVTQSEDGIFIYESKYAKDISKRFTMQT